jgi:HEAT repeat protein
VKIATAPAGSCASEAGPNLAIDLLAASFETAAEPVRLAIARVLGEVGGRHHATLMALLVQDPSPAVRRAAVGALAQTPGAARSEALRLALADEAGPVRMAAAAALGAGDDPGALDALARLLCDEDVEVRAAAVRAIAESTCAGADRVSRCETCWSRRSATGVRGVRRRPKRSISLHPRSQSTPCAACAGNDPEVVQAPFAAFAAAAKTSRR